MLFPKKTLQVNKTKKTPFHLKDRKPEDTQFYPSVIHRPFWPVFDALQGNIKLEQLYT